MSVGDSPVVPATTGTVIAASALPDGSGCILEYGITGIPDADVYSIRVSGRPYGLTYTREALDEVGWRVEPLILE